MKNPLLFVWEYILFSKNILTFHPFLRIIKEIEIENSLGLVNLRNVLESETRWLKGFSRKEGRTCPYTLLMQT